MGMFEEIWFDSASHQCLSIVGIFRLDTAKKRILEYLSVVKVKGDLKAPIICFVGPVSIFVILDLLASPVCQN